jgi:hypothetical protein
VCSPTPTDSGDDDRTITDDDRGQTYKAQQQCYSRSNNAGGEAVENKLQAPPSASQEDDAAIDFDSYTRLPTKLPLDLTRITAVVAVDAYECVHGGYSTREDDDVRTPVEQLESIANNVLQVNQISTYSKPTSRLKLPTFHRRRSKQLVCISSPHICRMRSLFSRHKTITKHKGRFPEEDNNDGSDPVLKKWSSETLKKYSAVLKNNKVDKPNKKISQSKQDAQQELESHANTYVELRPLTTSNATRSNDDEQREAAIDVPNVPNGQITVLFEKSGQWSSRFMHSLSAENPQNCRTV